MQEGDDAAMTENLAAIDGKSARPSKPYSTPAAEMVGREAEMGKILAAWMGGEDGFPLSPLLLGDPGLGKNRIVYECARCCGKELYICQGHEDVSAEDLACAVRFSDDPAKKMDYILSPLVTAMLRGGVCFVDEIAKIRPRALAPLASLLDERRYLDSNLLGERVFAHPGFRFVAATNTEDLAGSLLPDFIRSRMRPLIRVGYPGRREINAIVSARYAALNGNGGGLIDHFWELWQARNGQTPPTPRDSLYLFGYAAKLADFEALPEERPLDLQAAAGAGRIGKGHLERAFDLFFENAERTS
jgi:MoxR-like ATPase